MKSPLEKQKAKGEDMNLENGKETSNTFKVEQIQHDPILQEHSQLDPDI